MWVWKDSHQTSRGRCIPNTVEMGPFAFVVSFLFLFSSSLKNTPWHPSPSRSQSFLSIPQYNMFMKATGSTQASILPQHPLWIPWHKMDVKALWKLQSSLQIWVVTIITLLPAQSRAGLSCRERAEDPEKLPFAGLLDLNGKETVSLAY